MNRTIWKAVLNGVDVQDIEVPIGAEFLCAREQYEKICVWFRCDPAATKEHRKIAIIGTGNPAPADGHYLGTASLHGGRLMWELYT